MQNTTRPAAKTKKYSITIPSFSVMTSLVYTLIVAICTSKYLDNNNSDFTTNILSSSNMTSIEDLSFSDDIDKSIFTLINEKCLSHCIYSCWFDNITKGDFIMSEIECDPFAFIQNNTYSNILSILFNVSSASLIFPKYVSQIILALSFCDIISPFISTLSRLNTILYNKDILKIL